MEVMYILRDDFMTFLDQGDPRVKEWTLMHSPLPVMAMIIAYVLFVKVVGPWLMKKGQPYDLRLIMAVYNFALVLVNLWIFLEVGRNGWFSEYSLTCQPMDYSNRYSAVRMVEMGYYYLITRFVEFADTVFFVLRKKDKQISHLHVIHHCITPLYAWFGVKFASGGSHTFLPFLNSFVHVIMYTYYGMAALGDKYKKYLFWKKYLTYIQMVQFVSVIIHSLSLWYNKCEVAKGFIVMNLVLGSLFLILFVNYFVTHYKKSKRL